MMESKEKVLDLLHIKIVKIVLFVSVLWTLMINIIVNGFNVNEYSLIRSVLYVIFFFVIFYFNYGKPNIVAHQQLEKIDGENYRNELATSMSEIGLFKMLFSRWFVKKAKAASSDQ